MKKMILALILLVPVMSLLIGCADSDDAKNANSSKEEYIIQEFQEEHNGETVKKFVSNNLKLSYGILNEADVECEKELLEAANDGDFYTFYNTNSKEGRDVFVAGCSLDIPLLYDEEVAIVNCELFNCRGKIFMMPDDSEPRELTFKSLSIDYDDEIISENIAVDPVKYKEMVENKVMCTLAIQIFGDFETETNQKTMVKLVNKYVKEQIDNAICKVVVNYKNGDTKEYFYKIDSNKIK